MRNALPLPKVFISYSWTTTQHEEWVHDLATRLTEDGVEVLYDKWHLKEGHDIYAFMEKMVSDSEKIDKVLIICDEGYKNKANSRNGGVGTESQIITPEVYNDIKQEKFIPIISERDDTGNDFVPSYIKSRMYIDLSEEEHFEKNYEQLLRNIFKVPLYRKPPIGTPPSYITEEEKPYFSTKNVIRHIKNAEISNPKRLKSLWFTFVAEFWVSLKLLKIDVVKDEKNINEKIYEKINLFDPLRDDYIEVLEIMISSETIETDDLIEFFEKMYSFIQPENFDSYNPSYYQQYKFMVKETFLYTISILLQQKQFLMTRELLEAEYHTASEYYHSDRIRFVNFNFHLTSLVERSERLELNLISPSSTLIKERANDKYLNALLEADLMLFYISILQKVKDSDMRLWFPKTAIYNSRNNLKILRKLKSKRYFEKAKELFNVNTCVDLKRIINSSDQISVPMFNIHYDILRLSAVINPEEICSMP